MWLSLFSTFLSTTAGISKVYLFKYEGHSRKSEKNVEKNQTNNKKGKKKKKTKQTTPTIYIPNRSTKF